MKVSVIIPTYNRKRSLIRCLKALPRDVEVIVVDDGSTDETYKIKSEIDHPNLVFVRQSNSGPASARNTGVVRSSGEYIAFTDDDCIPHSPWPWPLVHSLQQANADIAGVGGKVLPLRNGLISRYYAHHRILEPPESCSYLVTANCAYRADVIRQTPGFDSRIHDAGGEDPGLSFEIRRMGYRLMYQEDAIVTHDFRQSIVDFSKTFHRYGKGCAQIELYNENRSVETNELIPSAISFSSIREEIKWHWNMYDQESLKTSERLKYLPLVLLQRVSYSMGWHVGSKM